MRSYSFQSAMLVFLILAGFGALAVALAAPAIPNNVPTNQDTTSEIVRSIITDAERIPLYPNALQVEIEPYDDRSPWRQVISYQAPA
jgi:hypothetical protein